jgi:hypothetical protein
MRARIIRLKAEIKELDKLSRSCDPDIASKMTALAAEMAKVVAELERLVPKED